VISLESRLILHLAGTLFGVALRARVLLAAGMCILALAGTSRPAGAALSPDSIARTLAGLETRLPAGVQLSEEALREYARGASARWADYERRIGTPMQKWARRELQAAHGGVVGGVVFYPFSGPDFATVQRMYPDASRYVLVALQRAEPPPSLDTATAADLSAFFARFGDAWKQFAQIGFFRTLDLDEEAKHTGLRAGTTAPLIAFAVRSGFKVINVEPVRVDATGADLEVHPGPRGESATWESVRISLERDGRKVLLDYVRINLSDTSLNARPERRAWIERMAANRTVLKAASHLPQDPRFTVVRDAILDRSPSVVQDETGIEYNALLSKFSVKLYGRFTRPHTLFNPELQRALAQAYKSHHDIKPLPFRVSYQRLPEANLQVAVRLPSSNGTAPAAPAR
jgi:hypothetical protein